MDNGEIVCIGEHEDLIENSELYRSLYYKTTIWRYKMKKRIYLYFNLIYFLTLGTTGYASDLSNNISFLLIIRKQLL